MKTIHVGLIGAGNISGTHARALAAMEGVALAAVFDTSAERAGALAAAHGAAAFDKLEAFLAYRPMDMVIVGTPSGLHAQLGIAAASHGLHVLTEKPIDISTVRADALIAACDAAGVRCGVVFQERYQAANLRLKGLIDGGGLGRPLLLAAHVRWYRPPEYYQGWHGTRALDGGGAIINQGIHTLDLLLWLFGGVARVQARTARLLHQLECEDTALALLEFSNGALGTLEVTTACYPGYERRLELSGTEGTVVLEGERIVRADLKHEVAGLVDAAVSGPGGNDERASSAAISNTGPHQQAIADFIEAVRCGRAPACDGAEGRRSLDLAERIYAAAGPL